MRYAGKRTKPLCRRVPVHDAATKDAAMQVTTKINLYAGELTKPLGRRVPVHDAATKDAARDD